MLSVAGDAQGSRWVTCSKHGARLWDAVTGRLVAETSPNQIIGRAALETGPGGALLLTGSRKGVVQFWQASDGASLGPAQQFSGEVVATAFGSGAAAWVEKDRNNNAFRVWQGTPGQPATQLWQQSTVIWNAAFSPNNRLLLTAGRDRNAQLWDVTTGKPARARPCPTRVR